MSEENNQEQAPDGGSGGAGEANGSAPSLNILAQYVKDLSFENPLAPAAAKAQDGGPDVDIRINVNGRHLQDNDYEVVLHFKVETKSGDETSFIVELLYGAVFRIQNVPEQDLKPVLLIEAPRQIFPFARRILADVTRDGASRHSCLTRLILSPFTSKMKPPPNKRRLNSKIKSLTPSA